MNLYELCKEVMTKGPAVIRAAVVLSDGTYDIYTRKLTDKEIESHSEDKRQKYNAVMLDAYTASMVVAIYEALGDKNKKNFLSTEPLKAIELGWKLYNKLKK